MPFPAALVQVDVDAGRIGRNYPVREGVVSDVGLFCDALLAAGVSGGRATERRRPGPRLPGGSPRSRPMGSSPSAS